MNETINLDDLRLFATVAETRNYTAAGRLLGLSKQTVSRRISDLEAHLGVSLIRRTTRKMDLTEVGAAYAVKCADIVRRAEDAARSVTDAAVRPSGTLRLTADPVFGDAFVADLIVAYAQKFPDVEIDAVFTRRYVDLIEEGFDLAFRVGAEDRPGLTRTPLFPGHIHYCASPSYLKARGTPKRPEDLKDHECILVGAESASQNWPFQSDKGPLSVSVTGRLRVTSFALALKAARAGLGIGLFPAFTCTEDIAKKRLRAVLKPWTMDVGPVSLIHPTHRFLSPKVRVFIDLAREKFQNLAEDN